MQAISDINIEKEMEIFEKELKSGDIKIIRSKNDEVDYALNKEDRDSQAVKEFAKTDLFQAILKME